MISQFMQVNNSYYILYEYWLDSAGASRHACFNTDGNFWALRLCFIILQFMNYLFSSHNTIWNPETTKLYQDMHQPISHYYIASSHNT